MFAHGDYQPLEASGLHREHVIAFARRRGRDAVIVAVAKSFAPMSQGGRVWPHGVSYEGTLDTTGYTLVGISDKVDATKVRFSTLFQRLPAEVLKARFEGA